MHIYYHKKHAWEYLKVSEKDRKKHRILFTNAVGNDIMFVLFKNILLHNEENKDYGKKN